MSKTIGQRLIERVEQAGDLSPGAFNLAADLLDIASTQAAGWTNRADDAVRIPDMLYDASIDLRRRADEVGARRGVSAPSRDHSGWDSDRRE